MKCWYIDIDIYIFWHILTIYIYSQGRRWSGNSWSRLKDGRMEGVSYAYIRETHSRQREYQVQKLLGRSVLGVFEEEHWVQSEWRRENGSRWGPLLIHRRLWSLLWVRWGATELFWADEWYDLTCLKNPSGYFRENRL